VFLLLSGWAIVLAAVALLGRGGSQAGFAAAGGLVEIVGLALLFRAHGSGLGARR
jgi:hypothetical protein